jgi:LmbE family N-acetylglucosaminyl deacetylase
LPEILSVAREEFPMRVRTILFVAGAVLGALAVGGVQANEPQPMERLLSKNTRLMVFSPHPDDETLGAGGLIQRVRGLGGKVKVVFITDGDGFPDGVQMEDHISTPTARDYIGYGNKRRQEALGVLKSIGLPQEDVIFLGFPDGGLCYLLWKFRHDPHVYTSPYTKENHPPPEDMIIPNTDYNGVDLRREIERVLTEFKPNLVAVTPPEDQHPDHCSTYHFVQEALKDLNKGKRDYTPRMVTFLIHFGQWPVGQGAGTGSRLNPPEGFPDQDSRWLTLSLRPEEAETKLNAILAYRTQMLVMGRFLLSFARANELFILEPQKLGEEKERMPCCSK